MHEKFEIFFSDLHVGVQNEILRFFNIKTPEEGNFDVFPLAALEREDEDEDAE